MKEKTVYIIGNQKIDENDIIEIRSYFVDEIVKLIMEGYYSFLVGDSLGFERLALETLIELKKVFYNIRITSCESIGVLATSKSDEDECQYKELKKQTDNESCVHEPRKSKILYKYKSMIQSSCLCVCFFTFDTDNTEIANVIEYAAKEKHRIINIAEVIKTHKENMVKTLSDPCKSEAYHFECDYTVSAPKAYDSKDKLNDFHERLGINKISDPFNFTPKMVIPEDKKAFFKLRDLLNAYVLFHHGKMTAAVDCEQWCAKFELILPFVEFTSIEELKLLTYIGERTHNFSVRSTDDGKVRMYIQINYFENI